MKLELKHLAPYLPYALPMMKGLHIGYLQCIKQPTENSLINYFEFMVTSSDYWENSIEDTNPYKPILRPLSDLTKDIEVNERNFVPIERIRLLTDENHFEYLERFLDIDTYEILPYWVFDILSQWHFDVFGLIDKGLAIDINTI